MTGFVSVRGEEAAQAIFGHIEGFYDTKRVQKRLGYLKSEPMAQGAACKNAVSVANISVRKRVYEAWKRIEKRRRSDGSSAMNPKQVYETSVYLTLTFRNLPEESGIANSPFSIRFVFCEDRSAAIPGERNVASIGFAPTLPVGEAFPERNG